MSIPARWTDANKVRLDALKNMPIELGDTACGRHEMEKKKDVVQAIKKMMPKERVAILQQMVEMDAADARND